MDVNRADLWPTTRVMMTEMPPDVNPGMRVGAQDLERNVVVEVVGLRGVDDGNLLA